MEALDSSNIVDYKRVLGQFCSGVTVVSALDGQNPIGFTCQAFTALSIDPPMISLSPHKQSSTWPKIRKSESFVVNILASDQKAISASFGKSGTDKFAGVLWSPSSRGLPIITGSLAWLDCEITQEIDAGDHTLVVATVRELGVGEENGQPLLFHRGRYLEGVYQGVNLV